MKFPAFEPIEITNGEQYLDVIDIPVSKIISDSNQPRKRFDDSKITELAESIRNEGLLQPIIVKSAGPDQYQLIAGERRLRAAKLAGINIIPAVVKSNDCYDSLGIQLIENIQREELNALELAEALYRLFNEYGLSHDAIGKLVGKSRTTVTNLLRLLNLSNNVQQLLVDGLIEMGHARAIITLSYDEQDYIANMAVEKQLSVRQVEMIVKKLLSGLVSKDLSPQVDTEGWCNKLSLSLSREVGIKINKKGSGKVEIYFDSTNEIDDLVDRLCETPIIFD